LRDKKWQIEDNLVLTKEKVYVLRDKELRTEIIWIYHEIPVAKHGRQWKTTELVTKYHW